MVSTHHMVQIHLYIPTVPVGSIYNNMHDLPPFLTFLQIDQSVDRPINDLKTHPRTHPSIHPSIYLHPFTHTPSPPPPPNTHTRARTHTHTHSHPHTHTQRWPSFWAWTQ